MFENLKDVFKEIKEKFIKYKFKMRGILFRIVKK